MCVCLNFLCTRAAERCLKEKRKTVTGEDILFAMATLGFDNYIEPLKNFLTKYKEVCRHTPPTHTLLLESLGRVLFITTNRQNTFLLHLRQILDGNESCIEH